MCNIEQNELTKLRTEISSVDSEILRLLSARRRISREIILAKNENSLPIRDLKREEELMNSLLMEAETFGLDSFYIKKVFNEIIEDSVRLQQKLVQNNNYSLTENKNFKVAIQGIYGSYSSLAAHKFFSPENEKIIFTSKNTFDEVIRSVEEGESEFAVLPVENTTSGGINEAYDALIHSNVGIIGEEIYRINHCLVASENTDLNKIKTIYAHPQAAAQCSRFLAALSDCKIEFYIDTAMSAQKVCKEKISTQAAIASKEAAEIFKLQILKEGIANQDGNYTRFLILARKANQVDIRIPCKTSLVMITAQKPGSLVEALTVLKNHNINMTKLESRPILGNPWEEMFYLDFEGNSEDPGVKTAIDELSKNTRFFKLLGSYPSVLTQNEKTVFEKIEKPEEEKSSEKPSVKVKSASKEFKLASRDYKSDDTIIELNGLKIGGNDFIVIAGPCSVESEKQIFETARIVKENGGHILRGGCFKPRTSPYAFQGMGLEGLELLYQAGKMYELPIITEILSQEFLDEVAEKSDIIQIGARNMQNFALLKDVGKLHKPVLLKRGMMSSVSELLSATEYILSEGNRQVILCERGIRTFETATRNTLDLSAVPVIKELSHLPIFVDPSHAVGVRDKVAPMALASKAVGAHGIMVEIHPEPEKALSDGNQSLYFEQFETLMKNLFAK